tara:strand:- start:100 stop:468 length:369 start_codon:yes stop_codon:yes gene_type:complete
MEQLETIKLNNVEYVRKDQLTQKALSTDGLQYVIIRTYSAGVHGGYLKSRNGKEVELLNSRRFYQWYGSSTLSQFAQSGTSQPGKCKFPEAVDRIILTEAIEIIDVTEKAKKTIDAVAVWKS